MPASLSPSAPAGNVTMNLNTTSHLRGLKQLTGEGVLGCFLDLGLIGFIGFRV